jgi:hypothetical protein
MTAKPNDKDQERKKGAVEQDEPGQPGNTSLEGQLGCNPIIKDADTDFPEPGESGTQRRRR